MTKDNLKESLTAFEAPARFTLSPVFVSKANERAGFTWEDDYGSHDADHLPHYYDWFAQRQMNFIPLWNWWKNHRREIEYAWKTLIIHKRVRPPYSDDTEYEIPVAGYAINQINGKFTNTWRAQKPPAYKTKLIFSAEPQMSGGLSMKEVKDE